MKGEFNVGSIVSMTHRNRDIGKGVVEYSSEELAKIKGKHTDEIEAILGYKNYDNVIRRENVAFT